MFGRVDFVKGHGTENDFVLLPDAGVQLDLTPDFVSALCDRHRGIGADGVLRVATAGALLGAGVLQALPAGVAENDWFMDYRNGDGSIAEMCGNGVRVFAHYLAAHDLVTERSFTVGSRAGGRRVTVHHLTEAAADVSVLMGRARIGTESKATIGELTFSGLSVNVGNPHLACVVEGLTADRLESIDLTAPITFDHNDFPEGVNIEVMTPLAEISGDTGDLEVGGAEGALVGGAEGALVGQVTMRVHERGVGETRSCGTGTVAAATAALRSVGRTTGAVVVNVPGGAVTVTVGADENELRGPSVLVGAGMLNAGWR